MRCGDRLTYFQSFDWCRSWVAAFAGEAAPARFRIETVWCEGSMVAVWPLMVQTVSGIRVLQNLGAPHSQYCNLLCDDALLADKIARTLLSRIEADPDCDVAVFHPVPQRSKLAKLLASQPTISGYQGKSALLDLAAFTDAEDYRSQGGKLKKRNRNRRRNHLARLGELSFEVVWPNDARFVSLVRQCAGMKRQWLNETGRTSSGFSFCGFEYFLTTLAGDPDTFSGACLSVLKAGDAVVATELGFLQDGHYYSYIGSFDWSIRHLSPGKVQMEMTVCWLIENGASTYDLLGGEGDYKQSWSDRTMALDGYRLCFSWKGRFYADAWLPVIRPFAKRLYQAAPEGLRRLVPGVQSFGLVILGV
ncbi:CelD/BcsL family acetyltransferase involved in cellulose biosynthesis [Pseudorhizobium tarimense]|uniref:CelD/BcsL family acetyltransferase involved in cellulose biosynthesis n=1 Tax=Pseudorhizobium tarimense TaxID=1079109 RepID=A0ABV2HAB6_9HYPH|nr:GNAT family N-acetyltransferase [Pseudorhizobium tarimense]MCJ8520597.1 GNAT family N-acetyltransferase [Pseudorhizobium tarimense]